MSCEFDCFLHVFFPLFCFVSSMSCEIGLFFNLFFAHSFPSSLMYELVVVFY